MCVYIHTYIYIRTHTRSVCYRKEKTARGPTLCTFTGSISFRGWCFSSRRRFLFRLYLISSDDFAGSLSGVRRLLLSRLLASHPYPEGGREGEGPEAVLSFPKAKSNQSPASSNSNSTRNHRLSPIRVHILVPLLSFPQERRGSGEAKSTRSRGIRGENGIRASIPRGTRCTRRRVGAEHC